MACHCYGHHLRGGFTFALFDALVSTILPGHVRMAMFDALPECWQREAWANLGREAVTR
jgi:hypothetical protein